MSLERTVDFRLIIDTEHSVLQALTDAARFSAGEDERFETADLGEKMKKVEALRKCGFYVVVEDERA